MNLTMHYSRSFLTQDPEKYQMLFQEYLEYARTHMDTEGSRAQLNAVNRKRRTERRFCLFFFLVYLLATTCTHVSTLLSLSFHRPCDTISAVPTTDASDTARSPNWSRTVATTGC